MPYHAEPFTLPIPVKAILDRFSSSRAEPHSVVQRATIVLKAAADTSYQRTATALNVAARTVGVWRSRWKKESANLVLEPKDCPSLEEQVRNLLADDPGRGRKPTFSAEQVAGIVALSLRCPSEVGVDATEWTCTLLAEAAVKEKIVPTISRASIGRLLKEADLKPHLVDGWLNPSIPDQAAFDARVAAVCAIYREAPTLAEQGVQVISTDEKTGIQATERLHADKPMRPGCPVKREVEYVRHGTQTLIAGMDVVTGKIIDSVVGDTRTEEDFTSHVERLIPVEPEGKVVIVADNLNTHVSEGVVRVVAKACEITEDLGEKGKSGILKSMETRREFLENPEHRVRFVFTPKHCSWLNQIEIWFGILSKRILRHGSFSSAQNLKERIQCFIAYFNEHWAKPFKWTYQGKLLMA